MLLRREHHCIQSYNVSENTIELARAGPSKLPPCEVNKNTTSWNAWGTRSSHISLWVGLELYNCNSLYNNLLIVTRNSNPSIVTWIQKRAGLTLFCKEFPLGGEFLLEIPDVVRLLAGPQTNN